MGLDELMAATVGFDVVGTEACVHGFEVDIVLTDHNHNVLGAFDELNRKATSLVTTVERDEVLGVGDGWRTASDCGSYLRSSCEVRPGRVTYYLSRAVARVDIDGDPMAAW